MAMVSSTDFVRASERTTAIATLNRQRHLTPSCGGFTPTAERTVGPARMIVESLTARPGIREQYRPLAHVPAALTDVRSWKYNGPSDGAGAMSASDDPERRCDHRRLARQACVRAALRDHCHAAIATPRSAIIRSAKCCTSPLDPLRAVTSCSNRRRDGRVANAERPGIAAGTFLLLCSKWFDLEVHPSHAAHATARRHAASAGVLLRHFGHHGFGGDQEGRDGRCILYRHTNHLGRVDDALGDQVDVFAGLRVEAVGILILLEDLADDHRTVFASIDGDLAGWIRQRLADDFDPGLLVVVLGA